MSSSRASTVQAVTFDVGGTLIEPWPSVGHIYAEEAARYGVPGLPVEIINRQFARAWGRLANFGYTRSEWAELVDASFHGLTELPPSRTFFSALYARFAQADAWRIFPEVPPVLKRLAGRGLRLGVISNWDRRLRPLLRDLKLRDYFHTMVVSCDLGVCKPAPEIFLHAARKLRVPPESVLHVGDSQQLDAEAARAAGMRGLWLDRGGAAGPGAGKLGTLAELGAALI
jgi:putative hydrolase of the HAD superfamily